jgi:hypothetical protein
VPGGACAVGADRNASYCGDLGGDLFRRQQPAEAGFGALAQLDLDGFDRAGGDGVLESVDIEPSGVVAAAEVAGADLEYKLCAMEVVR